MKFDFSKDKLPFEGFAFGGRSYAREVVDLNSLQKNGNGIIGDFLPRKGECELKENHLYLAVSRGGDKEITHLFTITNNKPSFIKESKAQKGAIKSLWKAMEDFLAQRPQKSPQQLLNLLLEQDPQPSRKTLKEVAMLIMEL